MGEGTLAINATKGYLVQLREFATVNCQFAEFEGVD